MNLSTRDFAGLRTLSVGHVTHDRYGDQIVPGGCAYYGAQTFHQLGAQTQLLTAVGDDFLAYEALAPFETHVLTGGNTTVFSNIYPPGEPRLQIVETQAPSLGPAQLPTTFRGADVLFVAPVMGELMEPGWVAAANARVACAGLQGFLKIGAEPLGGGRRVRALPEMIDPALLNGFDAVFLSEEDVAMVGKPDFLRQIISAVPIVALTDGENGCTIYEGGSSFRLGVYPSNSVDPTGAGDTFAAGMSLGLGLGWSTLDAARLGTAAASVIVEGWGAKTAPNLKMAFERFVHITLPCDASDASTFQELTKNPNTTHGR
jgi:sugar/nucleoside kinase (ribokinase family)